MRSCLRQFIWLHYDLFCLSTCVHFKIDKEAINNRLINNSLVFVGFQKRDPMRRRVPHYWVPVLKRTVVKSEVLNTHLSVTVTDRTIRLINDHYGFDHYLLKTPACDLVSMLALKLKKQILIELMNGCQRLSYDPAKQKQIYEEYKTYLSSVSSTT